MPPKKKPDTAGYQKLKKDLADQRPGQLYILHGEETYLRDCGSSCSPGAWGPLISTSWSPRTCPPTPWRRPSTACP